MLEVEANALSIEAGTSHVVVPIALIDANIEVEVEAQAWWIRIIVVIVDVLNWRYLQME